MFLMLLSSDSRCSDIPLEAAIALKFRAFSMENWRHNPKVDMFLKVVKLMFH